MSLLLLLLGLISYQIKASFLQIYNETLYDLLSDTSDGLTIREIPISKKNNNNNDTNNYEIYVSGLSEYRVQTYNDVMKILTTGIIYIYIIIIIIINICIIIIIIIIYIIIIIIIINIGTQNRTTRSTDFNATSSRSHAILQLTFEIESYEHQGQTMIHHSKLSLVDLAGSEKMSTIDPIDSKISLSDAPKHVKELTSINKSLSTLGNVISALSSNTRTHIPYRDSKLTRLLQNSLGGNTRTILIACIAPTSLHTVETMNTLAFADRAKSIMIKVRANTVVDDKELLARANQGVERVKKLLSLSL